MSDEHNFLGGLESHLRDHAATFGALGILAAQEQRSRQLASLEDSRREQEKVRREQAKIAAAEQERAALERERLELEKAQIQAKDARREAITSLRTMMADAFDELEKVEEVTANAPPLGGETRTVLRRRMAVLRLKATLIRSKEQVLDSLSEMQATRRLDNAVDKAIRRLQASGHITGDPVVQTQAEVASLLKWFRKVTSAQAKIAAITNRSSVSAAILRQEYTKSDNEHPSEVDPRQVLTERIRSVNFQLNGNFKEFVKKCRTARRSDLWQGERPDSQLVECCGYIAALGDTETEITPEEASQLAEFDETWGQSTVLKLENARENLTYWLDEYNHHAKVLEECGRSIITADNWKEIESLLNLLGNVRFAGLDYISVMHAIETGKMAQKEQTRKRVVRKETKKAVLVLEVFVLVVLLLLLLSKL